MLKILSLALIATGVLHNTLALLTMREALRRIGLTFWQLADANRLGWPPILALLALAAGIALLFPKAGPLLLLALALAFVVTKCGS